MNCIIMSGDTEVAKVIDNKIIPIIYEKMPMELALGGNFENWLENRAIDNHRPNSRLLKKILRISNKNNINTVLYVNGATITDNYWVKDQKKIKLKWKDIKFSDNYFADIALNGNFKSYDKTYNEKEIKSKTPEITNIGSYEKCWKIQNGEWYIYKKGSVEERYSELFIAQLCKELGYKTAEYENFENCIKTKNFTMGIWNFEPAYALVKDEEDYSFNYDKIKRIKEEMALEYLNIIYIDAICYNMDRHTYNYGFLRDQKTGEYIGMAPNFDNNIALISRGYGENPLNTNQMLMELFLEVIKNRNINYNIPHINKQRLKDISEMILPNENINRDYVVEMVYLRNEWLIENIKKVDLIQNDRNKKNKRRL